MLKCGYQEYAAALRTCCGSANDDEIYLFYSWEQQMIGIKSDPELDLFAVTSRY
jgi:hypothetical protein